MVFIQDIMAYSALNRPLTIQRPFARVWRGINHIETWNANSPLDIFCELAQYLSGGSPLQTIATALYLTEEQRR